MDNNNYDKVTADYSCYLGNKYQQKDNKQQRFRYSYEKAQSGSRFLENIP